MKSRVLKLHQSFSPSVIPVKDSDSFMEEIDLFFNSDDPMLPSIKEDDDGSERDILILEEFPSNYSLSLPVNESFRFDIPSFSRPPAKPPGEKEKLQQLKQVANLRTYPSKRFNSFCYDDDDDEDYTVVITPDFPITVSLIMENEHLDTILETESDEFIKSSVENLVPIPSESEDFSDIKNKCDMPDCDDSKTKKISTFSNPLFDDSTSSDDESSHEEVIHEISFKTYSNPIFDLDEEIISSEFKPIHNEDLDFTPKNDRFDTKSYLLESLLIRDESIPPGIDSDDSDSERDNLFLERLLHDDPIPLPDILDFSNVVQVFLPFFTYPMTSSILLSSGSEDTIFDPDISDYHFSSSMPVYLI
nr:hypothetical protein [Tanacetum cinerariifolium]